MLSVTYNQLPNQFCALVDYFVSYIYNQWVFIVGGNTQSNFDLHKTDDEFVLKRTTADLMLYPIQTGVRLNRVHYIKESHPLSKHTFIIIAKTQWCIGGLKMLQSVHCGRCCT